MIDLSVAVTPLYAASMAWEHRALQRRAQPEGPGAFDYLAPDTRTSLAMGALSLTTPISAALAAYAVPFRTSSKRGRGGRIGRAVVGVALTAAVATTIADAVAAKADLATAAGRRAKARARKVSQVGGVAAIAAGGVALTATTAAFTSATRMWKKGSRRDMGNGVLPWALSMVWWDLAYYWNHRNQHDVRGMWTIHVPHHSSQHYNLSTALRQPVAGAFGVWVPYGLIACAGVRPAIIETSRALNLIYQYWIHTDTIRTLGSAAESVLNTPSHHRVHHGRNKRYIDRNHAGILIIWDRLFGTFEAEDPAEPVVYGLTRNVESYNLWTVSTHEYRDMFRDVAHSTNWRDRLGFVLRTPGWAYNRRAQLAAAGVAAAP